MTQSIASTSFVSGGSLSALPSPLTEERLGQLARTYETAARPVWIHDLSARCVYRNPPALDVPPRGEGVCTFEIVDHVGRTIGHLTTGLL